MTDSSTPPQEPYRQPPPQPGQPGPQPGQPGPQPGQPGPQQPYQQLPPAYQPMPAQPPFNAYAIIAIVLAVMVLPPLGVYFGYVARRQIAVSGERGIELAQVAIVVGWALTALMAVGLLIGCVFFAIWLGLFGLILGAGVVSTTQVLHALV
jgi:Domain of unknown function (DUF4190)